MQTEKFWRVGLLLLLATITSGCLSNKYQITSEDKIKQPAGIDQNRTYPAYYVDPPSCVVVLPGEGVGDGSQLQLMEGALSRQLSGRIGRVIHPRERRHLVRIMAFDLHDRLGTQKFSNAVKCPTYLRWSVRKMGNNYTPIWSEKFIMVQAELIRAQDDETLWQAVATANRSSGDPPLSFFSLPLAIYNTAQFQNSQDTVASMIDDLARRLMVSLPDVRS